MGSSDRPSAGAPVPDGEPTRGAETCRAEPIAVVAAAAARARSLQEAGSALVDGIADSLDLESAYLYVIDDDGEVPRLRLLAHRGEHSAFMTDTPTIDLDADLPVVRVLLHGAADYVSDPHGLGEPVDDASGVGRWRAAIGAQAEATLPLLARGRAVGSLAMSWRSPRVFTDADKRELERMASAAALVLDGFAARVRSRQGVDRSETVTASFAVDSAGRVAYGADDPAASLSIDSATSRTGGEGPAPFCEVCACADARTAIAAGVVCAGGGSAAMHALEAKRLLCGWMGHGLEPAAALDALVAWSAREGDPARRVCAVACIVDTARRCVTYAVTRHALAAVLTEDGRLVFDAAPAEDSAPAGPASERAAVLLPGDRLVLWSGDAPGFGGDDGPESALRLLAGYRLTEGAPAAALVKGRGAGGCCAVAAVVVDVRGVRP